MTGGSDFTVAGPLVVAFVVLYFAIWLLSLYVGIDSVRRRSIDFFGLREPRWLYTVAGLTYFVVYGLEQVPAVSIALPWLGFVAFFGMPLSVAVSTAYLLRVRFPTRARLEARSAEQQERVWRDLAEISDSEDD